jgi:hypothetical protein
MMGMDNITCPSKAPVAGCAVGVPASVRTRGFGPQLAAARCELRSGIQIAWVARQRRWHGGMWVIDCPGERRVRENRMHGVGGGGRKRTDDAQPRVDRWVAYRQRASRLPHLVEISAGVLGCPVTLGVLAGWEGTAASVRASLAVEKSAEVVLPAGSVFAGKDRTRSRGAGRSCSWDGR